MSRYAVVNGRLVDTRLANIGGNQPVTMQNFATEDVPMAPPDPGDEPINVLGRSMKRSDVAQYDSGRFLLSTIDKQSQRGFLESISDVSAEDLPFIGDVAPVAKLLEVKKTFDRINEGQQVSDGELVEAQAYLANEERKQGQSWGGMAGGIIRQMPGFMFEFGVYTLAGGPVGIGAGLTKKAAMKAAAKGAQTAGKQWLKRLGVEAVTGIVKGTGVAALDTAVNAVANLTLGNEALESKYSAERQLMASASGDPMSATKAQWMGIGDRYIEYLSESAGSTLGELMFGSPAAQAAGTTIRGRILSKAGQLHYDKDSSTAGGRLLRAFLAENRNPAEVQKALKAVVDAGPKSDKFIPAMGYRAAKLMVDKNINPAMAWEMLKKAGYDGYIEEMAEERFGGFMRGLVGLESDGGPGFRNAVDNMWWDNLDQFKAEAVAFAAPIVAVNALSQAQNKLAFGTTMSEIRERTNRIVAFTDANAVGDEVAEDSTQAKEAMQALRELRDLEVAHAGGGFLGRVALGAVKLAKVFVTGDLGAMSHPTLSTMINTAGGIDFSRQLLMVESAFEKEYGKLPEAEAKAKAREAADNVFIKSIFPAFRQAMQVTAPEFQEAAKAQVVADAKGAGLTLSQEEVDARATELNTVEFRQNLLKNLGIKRRLGQPLKPEDIESKIVFEFGSGIPVMVGTPKILAEIDAASNAVLKRQSIVTRLPGTSKEVIDGDKLTPAANAALLGGLDSISVSRDEIASALVDPGSASAVIMMQQMGINPLLKDSVSTFRKAVKNLLDTTGSADVATVWMRGGTDFVDESANGRFRTLGSTGLKLADEKVGTLSFDSLTKAGFVPFDAATGKARAGFPETLVLPEDVRPRGREIRFSKLTGIVIDKALDAYQLLARGLGYVDSELLKDSTVSADRKEQLAAEALTKAGIGRVGGKFYLDVGAMNDMGVINVTLKATNYHAMEDLIESNEKRDRAAGGEGYTRQSISGFVRSLQAELKVKGEKMTDAEQELSKFLAIGHEAPAKLFLMGFMGFDQDANRLPYQGAIAANLEFIRNAAGAGQFASAMRDLSGLKLGELANPNLEDRSAVVARVNAMISKSVPVEAEEAKKSLLQFQGEIEKLMRERSPHNLLKAQELGAERGAGGGLTLDRRQS